MNADNLASNKALEWPGYSSSAKTAEELIETNALLTWASQRFADLFRDLPVICFCYDQDGCVYEWNRACEQETGFTGDQVVQQRIWETFFRPEDKERLQSITNDVFNGKTFTGLELEMVRFGGAAFPVLNNTYPLRHQDGTVVGVISANVNIEDRVHAESALRVSEERLRLAVEIAQLGTWQWDLKTNVISWSEIDARLMGFPPGRLCVPSELFLSRIHPDDRARVESSMRYARETGSVYEREFRIVRPDGTIRWAIVHGTFVLNELDQPTKIIGTTLDITDRKEGEDRLQRAQDALEARVQQRTRELAHANEALHEEITVRRAAEEDIRMYGEVVRNMPLGVVVYHLEDDQDDYSLKITLYNSAVENRGVIGAKRGIGCYVRDVYPPSTVDQLAHRVAEVVRTGEPDSVEQADCDENGALRRVLSIQIFPLPNRRACVVVDDITEKRRSIHELQRAHAQNAQILGSIGSILICVDEKYVVTSWNTMASHTFGTSATDTVGRKLTDTAIQWDWEPVMMALYECNNTNLPVRLEDLRYTSIDCKECFLGLTINPLKDVNEKQSGFLLLATDITKRRVLESQLAQSQKLESIGNLAAGIAHEINTPIQYVGDNTRFLNDAFLDLHKVVKTCKDIVEATEKHDSVNEIVKQLRSALEEADVDYLTEEIPSAINQSLEGVERVAHIVRAMKEFSHPGQEEMTSVDLNRAIDSTITVARNEWKYVADIHTDFEEDLPAVPCYPSSFNQVILNMIINAAHAISDVVAGSNSKGTISVSTRRAGGMAEITISDTGTGIPADILGRIYDPFFTTKPVGRGTGQGLSISHTVIVEKHQGTIDVDTKVGSGTTFTIRLPLHRKST
ncbi:MAG: PAS domain S-box protein [Capsulimonadaceae bacterium]|nr:PAS domain S-box protein [Capsulimonadaceae bacterium]